MATLHQQPLPKFWTVKVIGLITDAVLSEFQEALPEKILGFITIGKYNDNRRLCEMYISSHNDESNTIGEKLDIVETRCFEDMTEMNEYSEEMQKLSEEFDDKKNR